MWVAVTSSCWFVCFLHFVRTTASTKRQHCRQLWHCHWLKTDNSHTITILSPTPPSLHGCCRSVAQPTDTKSKPWKPLQFTSAMWTTTAWRATFMEKCLCVWVWKILKPADSKSPIGGSGLWPLATLLGLPECCHSLGATWSMVSLRASEQGHRMQLVLQSGLEWFKFLFLLSSYTVASTKELSQQHYSINAMNPELLSWYVVIFCRQNKIC